MTTERNAPGYSEPTPVATNAAVDASTAVTGGKVERYSLRGTGIVLRIKGVSQQALRAAAARIPDPAVPVHHIESQNRDEPNPNHPDYLRALVQANNDRIMAQYTTALIMGTEVLDVPPGMHRPEDDGWIDEIEEALSIGTDDGEPSVRVKREPRLARYLDYLRMYAITDPADEFILSMLLVQGVALSEQEVEAAMASFRDRQRRDALVVLPDALANPDRDYQPPGLPRDGDGVRGTAGGAVEPDRVAAVAEPQS